MKPPRARAHDVTNIRGLLTDFLRTPKPDAHNSPETRNLTLFEIGDDSVEVDGQLHARDVPHLVQRHHHERLRTMAKEKRRNYNVLDRLPRSPLGVATHSPGRYWSAGLRFLFEGRLRRSTSSPSFLLLLWRQQLRHRHHRAVVSRRWRGNGSLSPSWSRWSPGGVGGSVSGMKRNIFVCSSFFAQFFMLMFLVLFCISVNLTEVIYIKQ